MRKTLILMGVVSLLVSAAWAHVPADRTFLAFQWPDSAVPTIDGDLSEWAVVPEVYVVKPEDTHESLYSNAINKADLDFRGYVGYNDASDKMIMGEFGLRRSARARQHRIRVSAIALTTILSSGSTATTPDRRT